MTGSQAAKPGPITGAPGDTPIGQASEIQWSAFRILPPSASSYADDVDAIALTWTAFSAVLIVLVFGMLTAFSIKYLRKGPAVRRLPHRMRNKMEWSWTLLLLVIAIGIGVWADWTFFKTHVPPKDAAEIYVVGKQWMWKLQHPDGTREINELHVPVGEDIKLVMSSQDVIHSFYVPAFRIKQDVVPGRYTYLWFKANKPGVYRLFCAEFCGTSHSNMNGKVYAMSREDYLAWKKTHSPIRSHLATTNLASQGRELFTRLGCISCHGQRSKVLAPPLQGLYMSQVGLRTGETVLADENYIRESILNPRAKIVKGYEAIMPSFQGQINEEDLLSLISYIKSLQYYPRTEP